MGMTRELDNIYQGLTLPAEQRDIMIFLANTENAQMVNSLVEDIREALMEYQVCIANCSFLPYLTFVLDFSATAHLQQELSAHCESHPPISCFHELING